MMELTYTARVFGQRPSSFISGISGYAAYCFDTAAAIYIMHLEKGDKPVKREVNALSFL